MNQLNLSSLNIKNPDGIIIGKIDPIENTGKSNYLDRIHLIKTHERVFKIFQNWYFLGFFKTQCDIVDQLKPFITDNSISLTQSSFIEYNPIWNSYGEVNFRFCSRYFSNVWILKKLLEFEGVKVTIRYSVINTIITFFHMLLRNIVSFGVVIILVIRYFFIWRSIPPEVKKWSISRGLIHSKEWKNLEDSSYLAYLNSWFRPFQNSKFLKNEKKTFWLGNLVKSKDIIYSLIQCYQIIGIKDILKFNLLLPYLQMDMYGRSVSRLRKYSPNSQYLMFELLYPFNSFLDFKEYDIFISIMLPSVKMFPYAPERGVVYFKYQSYLLGQKNVNNISTKQKTEQLINIDRFINIYDPKSQNCVFFTQPIYLQDELNIIEEVISHCNALNLKLFIQLHPRSNKKDYHILDKHINFVSHYRDLKNIKLAFIRNSSIGEELTYLRIPVICCLWGKLREEHSFKYNKGVKLIKEKAQLHECF